MPKVEFSLQDLNELLKELSPSELEERGILFAKGEIESLEGNLVKVDIKDTNRPDLWSVEGIARELRGHYGIEKGLPVFEVRSSGIEMRIDRKVERVRPKAVAAVVKGLSFNDDSIKQMIQLQEKVTQNYGRNRSLVAIGVYDWATLKPPIRYTTVAPDAIRFMPLDFEEELTPREILERHPKGREFGHLIEGFEEYPLMIDSEDNVLSIPPIINSAYTGKVTEATRDVFIEVTGHEVDRISVALNILVAALSDRGGRIESVEVVYPETRIVTPDFTPGKITLDTEECRRILGLELEQEEMIELLERARYRAVIKDGNIVVEYPGYRRDIMHQRDVMEDIAIAYDLNRIPPEPPELSTTGKVNEKEDFADLLRVLMVGLGFQEVLTFSLTSKENLFERMNVAEDRVCEIANPISSTWTALRNWLLPSVVEFLANNLHVEYPQCVFEVGDIVEIDEGEETRTRNVKKLACAITSGEAGYEEASSVLDALFRNLGLDYVLKRSKHGSFISGRVAEIFLEKESIGIIGEIHPQVLNNWGLEKPVVAFELSLEPLMKRF
ncbi:MAG: phenylalanine--tRNA ligase subunit beta [Candidatus Hydrothermarchaeales archaeon]